MTMTVWLLKEKDGARGLTIDVVGDDGVDFVGSHIVG